MLDIDVDKAHSIVMIRPHSRLDKQDFAELANSVDPQIEEHGDLAGIIIDAPSFPGWDSFGSLVSHIRFVREHHRHVKKIAIVTDSAIGDVGEHIARHFVSAEIKHFPPGRPRQPRSGSRGTKVRPGSRRRHNSHTWSGLSSAARL